MWKNGKKQPPPLIKRVWFGVWSHRISSLCKILACIKMLTLTYFQWFQAEKNTHPSSLYSSHYHYPTLSSYIPSIRQPPNRSCTLPLFRKKAKSSVWIWSRIYAICIHQWLIRQSPKRPPTLWPRRSSRYVKPWISIHKFDIKVSWIITLTRHITSRSFYS